MNQDQPQVDIIELKDEVSLEIGVWFDPYSVTLEGLYDDELSAYRARRAWRDTLERSFLLEEGHDFALFVQKDKKSELPHLVCEFHSACARYAFWRLTNGQASEAQYSIETAHISDSTNNQRRILAAPDLRSLADGPSILRGDGRSGRVASQLASWLRTFTRKLRDL